MFTIAYVPEGCQLRTADADDYNLKLGQVWEDAITSYLTAHGLPAYRPRQCFVDFFDHYTYRKHLSCSIVYDHKASGFVPRRMNQKLLRPHQRDVMVKIGPVKRLSVEVKALCPGAFRAHSIQVGETGKWDDKAFKVDAVILINQQTGVAYVAPSQAEWLKQQACDGTEKMCYAVPNHRLSPLDTWIDFVKDSYRLT